jgi:hypothetical protein
MGLNYNNMADTTNATYDGGIDVPHECLSGANISIIPEPSKQFPKFNIKQKDAGLKSHVPYVLSYYNNYVIIC